MAFSVKDVRETIDATLAPLGAESVLGIDVGGASLKIVQMRHKDDIPTLETYGELPLGPYNDIAAGQQVQLVPKVAATAIQDLIHEIAATARGGGMAIPLSSTLISVVDLPKRDEEQMNRFIRGEVQKYIPVPIERVDLDWFSIPNEELQENAFDRAQSKMPAQIKLQKVFLAATNKEVLLRYEDIARASEIRTRFLEIESFSVIRALRGNETGPALVLDIGASSSKICIASRHKVMRAAHSMDIGGQSMTEAIMKSLGWDFEKSEGEKQNRGLSASSPADQDSEKIYTAIKGVLEQIFLEVDRLLQEYNRQYKEPITHAVLVGGGAKLQGLIEYAKERLKIDVKIGNPFEKVHGPMVLEDTLRDVGPKYAVAIGLALRAQERKR